jgi:hypothetical protein
MTRLRSFLPLCTGLLAALSLVSCSNFGHKGPQNSFTFDPPVTQASNPAAVRVKVSTGAQKLYVVEGNQVLLATPVTVGRAATPTPHGTFPVRGKVAQRRRQSQPGAGYPMTYWIEFYKPAYGMHWGFIKPYPNTAGCIRIPLKAARKVFHMVRVGTPIDIAKSQPWDSSIGASLPVLDDSELANPPWSYMTSPQVFQDAEKGKMWNF